MKPIIFVSFILFALGCEQATEPEQPVILAGRWKATTEPFSIEISLFADQENVSGDGFFLTEQGTTILSLSGSYEQPFILSSCAN